MLRALVVLSVLAVLVNSHGRFREPPSRASMWRDGFNSVIDVNDNQCNCGGFRHQYEEQKGKCGICGDPWDQTQPREHELGGTYGEGNITRTYTKGQVINVWVEITANHLGWFEFRLCPLTNPGPLHDATQECLDQHLLQLADGSGSRFTMNEEEMNYHLRLKLPSDLTCEHCLLQWHWFCATNWGICPDGEGRDGCGDQEVFRGCADVSIL